jgi:uncharacterized protein
MTAAKALIIFAKLPQPGEVKTRLGKDIGFAEAATVYRELAENAFKLGEDARSNGIGVYLFYDPSADESAVRGWVGRDFHYLPQKGNSLGERMHLAFDATFTGGATTAVIIGTDIPELTVAELRGAYSLLDSVDVAIGPATDGGYYLLGMKPPTKEIFSGIAWSTPEVYAKTIEKIGRLGLRFAALRELADIDTADAYRHYIRRTSK